MMWIIGIAAFAIALFVVMKRSMQKQGIGAVKRFELPEDSDKESFTDPATGKKYDKEAYCAYLAETAARLSEKQLRPILDQRGAQSDVWNQLLCEVIRAELDRRLAVANGEAAAEEETAAFAAEAAVEVNEEGYIDIAPFFWVEQESGASVGLDVGEYLADVFKTREGFEGNGYDWNSLAEVFLAERKPGLRAALTFDSEAGMFSVYSRDEAVLREFIVAFRTACEDRETILDLFSRAKQN